MATRIKGKSLVFTINSVDYDCDATAVNLVNEEAEGDDATTFCDAATGGTRQWYLDVTAVSATDSGSLWRYLWDNAGTTGVAFEFAPNGNDVATTDAPHFTGTVDLPSEPGIGGEANSTWTFEVRLEVNGTPTLVTA